MTDIPSTHDWHMVDATSLIEAKRLSEDHYQLRSPETYIDINAAGFKLFREDNPESWNSYLAVNGIEIQRRTDV